MASVELFARLTISLVVIGGLVLLARRLLVGRLATDRRGPGIEVLARRQIGQKSSLVLVRCGARTLLIGADAERLSLLGEGDDLNADLTAVTAVPSGDGRSSGDDPAIDLIRLERLAAPAGSPGALPALGPGRVDAADDADEPAGLSVDEVLADLGVASAPVERPEPVLDLDAATAHRAGTATRSTTLAEVEQLLQQSPSGARTHRPGPTPEPTRMSVIEALREVTVRKG